jgi:hypothetical protein
MKRVEFSKSSKSVLNLLTNTSYSEGRLHLRPGGTATIAPGIAATIDAGPTSNPQTTPKYAQRVYELVVQRIKDGAADMGVSPDRMGSIPLSELCPGDDFTAGLVHDMFEADIIRGTPPTNPPEFSSGGRNYYLAYDKDRQVFKCQKV